MEHFSPITNWRLVESLLHRAVKKDPHWVRWEWKRGDEIGTHSPRRVHRRREHDGLDSLPGEWCIQSTHWAPQPWDSTLRRIFQLDWDPVGLKDCCKKLKNSQEYTCLVAPWCKVEELDWNCLRAPVWFSVTVSMCLSRAHHTSVLSPATLVQLPTRVKNTIRSKNL